MSFFSRLAAKIWKPADPIPRTDRILFGYYGADDAQIAETADHASVLWDIGVGGVDAMVARLVAAKMPAIIELRDVMFEPGPDGKFLLRADAEARLFELFGKLGSAGVQRNILALAPIDEPDINTNPTDQRAANEIVKRVFIGKPLAVIFAGVSRLWCIEDYAFVGFDDYPEGERIFDVTCGSWPPQSDYDRLISRLRPDQRVILVPGGGDPWRQDPARWIEKARTDGRVAMLLAFIWIERGDCATPQAGIRTNGMADIYRTAKARLA